MRKFEIVPEWWWAGEWRFQPRLLHKQDRPWVEAGIVAGPGAEQGDRKSITVINIIKNQGKGDHREQWYHGRNEELEGGLSGKGKGVAEACERRHVLQVAEEVPRAGGAAAAQPG